MFSLKVDQIKIRVMAVGVTSSTIRFQNLIWTTAVHYTQIPGFWSDLA